MKMRLIDSKLYRNDLAAALEKIDLSELRGKSVAITGGLGLIGAAICDLLWCYGQLESIYILARSQEEYNKRYSGETKIHFAQYDALQPLALQIDVDYIIHCAGVAKPNMYISAPVETMLSNICGVLELLKYARANKVKRLLYISSSEIYGSLEQTQPFSEEQYGIINIDSVRSSYPMAKKASECLCKAFASEYDVDTVIARPGHIYGPTANETDTRVSSLFPYLAAKGKAIELKSAGRSKRSYCYAIDAAVQIMYVLLRGDKGQSYNIGSEEATTIYRMAEICAAAGGTELRVKESTLDERQAFNPMDNSALDNMRVKQLGYRESFPVKEGLCHTVQILREML